MRTDLGCLFRVAKQGSQTPSLEFVRDLKAEDWEGFIVGGWGDGGGCGYALIRCCWHGETGDRPTRNKASYVIGLGSIFSFLWLVLS